MPPPMSKDERDELDAFKSDTIKDVTDITEAAKRHVEKVVAPFAPLAQKVSKIEAETAAQTPILEDLKTEAGLAKKARIAARKERIKRRTLDADRRKREEAEAKEKKAKDAAWYKWRKRVAGIVATFVALAELYNLLRGHK